MMTLRYLMWTLNFFLSNQVSLKVGIHYTNFDQLFCIDLQSGQVNDSCQKSETVCRFELTDFTENCVMYDGHRQIFFSFRLQQASHAAAIQAYMNQNDNVRMLQDMLY